MGGRKDRREPAGRTEDSVVLPTFTVRRLSERDYPLISRWRSDPRVLEFFGGRDSPLDEEAVRAKYQARRRDRRGRFIEYIACVAELHGKPIAFVQHERWPRYELEALGMDPGERTYAIDLFIGNPKMWGRGLGSRLVREMADHLIRQRGAARVTVDPRVDNARAIRAYEKAGFRKVQVLPMHEVHEGKRRDCWLMVFGRHSRRR
jgi:aminoglycoside 6'-N-acetyltransferase